MSLVKSAVLVGVNVVEVTIEAFMGNGFTGLNIIGLPSQKTRDIKERIRAAMESSGFPLPARRIIVSLTCEEDISISRSPLEELEYAIAASLIHLLKKTQLAKTHFYFGSLTLQGSLRPLKFPLLARAISTLNKQAPVFTPLENNISNSFKTHNLKSYSSGSLQRTEITTQKDTQWQKINPEPFSRLKKQPLLAFTILLVAAARHSALLIGSPGIGKSHCFSLLPSLLPQLTPKEKVEVDVIYAGIQNECEKQQRPFRTPHHSTTSAAMIGGAKLTPGEITLAHNGTLFLDELIEFPRSTLESLREPIDHKSLSLSRAMGSVNFPADFLFCAASNPCKCGFLFSQVKACRCNPSSIKKSLEKLSGPLLDRFDLQIIIDKVEPVFAKSIFHQQISNAFSSQLSIQKLLERLRNIQKNTFHPDFNWNSHVKAIPPANETSLSVRGSIKLKQLTWTVMQLFPDLHCTKTIMNSILELRSAEKLMKSGLIT